MYEIISKFKDAGLGLNPDIKDGKMQLPWGEGLAYGLIGAGVGLAMIGAIGSGHGQGEAAGRAAQAVGRNPENESKIRIMMIMGQAIAASSSIYSLVVAIILLFVY